MNLDSIKQGLRERWDNFESKKKKVFVVSTVIVILVILSILFYVVNHKPVDTANEKKDIKKKEIGLEPKLLEKSQFAEMQKEFSSFKEKLNSLEEMQKKNKEEQEKKPPEQVIDKKSSVDNSQQGFSIEPKTSRPTFPVQQPPVMPEINQPVSVKKEPVVYKNIEIISQTIETKEKEEDKKKENLKIYLPPSFMEATLLSGIDAPTSEGAEGHPAPVIIRIKDLAILPNKVKANLRGCFVIAEGYGNLSDERAHLRLTNLSCLSKKGQSVIDQKVKGFIVDSDGKIGLRGRVVAKFGSKIAMSLLAGLFQGAGDALKDSTTQSYISSIGTSQVVDTSELGRRSIGGAFAQAAKELQKFYLDLGKQTMPVVEIGAMKNITLVISEGTLLEVKERDNACIGGKECEQ